MSADREWQYGVLHSPSSDDEYSDWFTTLDAAMADATRCVQLGGYVYVVQRLPFDVEAIRKEYAAEVCKCGHAREQHAGLTVQGACRARNCECEWFEKQREG